jgi:hypothetical protein
MVEKGFKISTGQRDENGKQIDPEEKRVERILETSFPVGLQAPAEEGKAPVSIAQTVEQFTGGKASRFAMPQTVNIVGDAIEFASGMKHRCSLCLNFDNEAFLKWKQKAEWDPEKRKDLMQILGQIMEREPEIGDQHVGQDGDFDEQHALNCCGICRELTSIFGDECIMWPDSGCPDYRQNDLVEPQFRVDFGHLFKPRDRDAITTGNRAYDTILKAAQGTPTRSAKRVWRGK